MGTTVTTNLGLIKPDTAESIKANLPSFAGWASQNSANCNAIDALFRTSNFTSYSLNMAPNGGTLTLGTGGFQEGKYLRLWPRMVIAYFRFFAGTTGFTSGTGSYLFDPPTTVANDLITTFRNESLPIGKTIFQDNNAAATCTVYEVCYSNALGKCLMRPSQGGVVTGAGPVTISNNDRFSGYLIYPTSDA